MLGPGDESGARLQIRVQSLLTVSVLLANGIGIGLVIVLLVLVIPGRDVLSAHLAWVNFLAVPTYALVALVVGGIWGTTWVRRTLRWSIEDREATEQDRIATLRAPWRLTIVSATLWSIGTGVFALLYGLVEPAVVDKIAYTNAMAGLVVCAITYLVAQFALRPVAARALTAAPNHGARGVGITVRWIVIWFLGGVPVVGLMLIAIDSLIRHNVTSHRLAVAMLGLGATALFVGFLLIVLNARAMVAPIRTVTAALAKVQQGDLDAEVLVFDGTELGLLQKGFNQMVHDVREREHIRDLFGRHVGEDVARAAMSRQTALGGEVRDVAVLFVDVVGSTVIATEQPPEEVVNLLNRFFAVVVDEVNDHGGFVNKFEGDAALAIFGAPEELLDAAGCALATARSIMARLKVDVPEIEAGIGVAAGPAVAGNVGAEDRFEYTVIGDPVNEGARLSEAAKTVDGKVVASMRAVEAASRGEAQHWTALEEVSLRGRKEPTTIAVPVDAPA
jgi:adenylate cyclase